MDYRAAKHYILNRLRGELSDKLAYHGLHHTFDVLRVATSLSIAERVPTAKIPLVKTAALFHDAGFVKNKHTNHEAEGCEIVRTALPDFGYTPADIEEICGMIMATKIPQSPKNLLEQIICDADLDYLGRDDFYKIGATLFAELTDYQLLSDEKTWNRLQVSFLTQHQFFTQTNIQTRQPVKLAYLDELKKLVATYD